MSALVIGYGNPLRRDDGAGWHAARLLASRFEREKAYTIAAHQLDPEMAGPVAQADVVVFIDAANAPQAGHFHLREVFADEAAQPFTHHLTPETLLAYARVLYGAVPRAFLISIDVQDFAVGDGLSPAVQHAVTRVCAATERIVLLATAQIADG
jgi:hydrogenase maturation protease